MIFRNPWTEEEDLILMKEYLKYKSRWTEISKKIKGRNIYTIKNRIPCLCNKFRIPKNRKAIEESFSKIIEQREGSRKKVHHDDTIIENYKNMIEVQKSRFICIFFI